MSPSLRLSSIPGISRKIAFTFLQLAAIPALASELPRNYEDLSGCEKEEFIWNDLIIPTTYQRLPDLEGLDIFGFTRADMKVTVQRISDEMPTGRTKYIHKRGAVAAVVFEAEPGSQFTGLFQGAQCGLLRAGLAIAPGGLTPVVPGAALKLFVDGRPSANFPFMPSLDGQSDNYNFFEFPFLTSIPEPKSLVLKVLRNIFARASSSPTQLSLNHVSRFNENGTRVEFPKAPLVVEFVPTSNVQFPSSPARDVRPDFFAIPAGTIVFEAFEVTTSGMRGAKIGRVVTKTKFVASKWGDDGLFFKHQTLEDKDVE